MEEDRIEAALNGLSQQMPHAPADTVERMVRTVKALGSARQRTAGAAAEPELGKTNEMTVRKPVRHKDKTL